MNFRADRAREITRALTDETFGNFERAHFPRLAAYITLSKLWRGFSFALRISARSHP